MTNKDKRKFLFQIGDDNGEGKRRVTLGDHWEAQTLCYQLAKFSVPFEMKAYEEQPCDYSMLDDPTLQKVHEENVERINEVQAEVFRIRAEIDKREECRKK
ncbi:MAG: hypothetical protein ACRDF4_09100 [Rhabdochlamydiaceae bacterium]